jgi:hypothetical protein
MFDRERYPSYPFPEDSFWDELISLYRTMSERRRHYLISSLTLTEEDPNKVAYLKIRLNSFREL